MTNQPILVIGSTGKTGSRIVTRLEAQGHTVRHGSRGANPSFDWNDRATWAPALEGIGSMYIAYYPDLLVPRAADDIRELMTVATDAGVKHAVLLSGRGESGAEVCEQIVRDSGLSYTLIRASWFFQNFTEGMLMGPVMKGVIAMPAGEVREPFVDADDIADVAVAALTDGRHAGKLYELTGPELVSFSEAAREVAEASGREVAYVPITLEQFHGGLEAEAGKDAADLWTALCEEVLDGRNESVSGDIETVLGRPASEFKAFVRSRAAAGAWA